VLHTTQAAIVQAGADARRQLKALIGTALERLRDRLPGAALAPAGPRLRQAGGYAWGSGGAPGHRAGARP
jgi:hypothetical protein